MESSIPCQFLDNNSLCTIDSINAIFVIGQFNRQGYRLL
jgi:hypothetical protein